MRACEECERSIVGRNKQARYCSTRCRVAAHRRAKTSPIPAAMLEERRWVRRNAAKVPLTIDGKAASSTDPTTWATYQEATASSAGIGLGFALGDGIGCIDLDHCVTEGVLNPHALAFVRRYPNNYIEYSPSGTGLHIWGTREPQPGTRRIQGRLNVETYSEGRYITITGNVYQPGTLAPL